jgi:hypothetical protein
MGPEDRSNAPSGRDGNGRRAQTPPQPDINPQEDHHDHSHRAASGSAPSLLPPGSGSGAQAATIFFAFQDLETEFWVAGHMAITTTLTEGGHTVIETQRAEGREPPARAGQRLHRAGRGRHHRHPAGR